MTINGLKKVSVNGKIEAVVDEVLWRAHRIKRLLGTGKNEVITNCKGWEYGCALLRENEKMSEDCADIDRLC